VLPLLMPMPGLWYLTMRGTSIVFIYQSDKRGVAVQTRFSDREMCMHAKGTMHMQKFLLSSVL
jgi:hypothetical protein